MTVCRMSFPNSKQQLGFATIHLADTDQVFQSEAQDTVLRAALRSGIGFPYECNSGGCGNCMYQLLSGEVDEIWPQAPGLNEKARERGRRLACQTIARGDCQIKVRQGEKYLPSISPRRYSAVLQDVRRVTDDMSEFTLKTDSAAQFLPGQFALLSLPGVTADRAYSMSNTANSDGCWTFIIKRFLGGQGSHALFESMKIGDEVELDGPFGVSYLRTDSRRDIVCVAGGSGLSPILSIIRGAVESPDFASQRILLFYGGRTPQDICVKDELAQIPGAAERVEVYTAISDQTLVGTNSFQGYRGFVHELLNISLEAEKGDFEYYFCGPPPMTDAVQKCLLIDHKIPSAQLHFDRFL